MDPVDISVPLDPDASVAPLRSRRAATVLDAFASRGRADGATADLATADVAEDAVHGRRCSAEPRRPRGGSR